jgi:hypothetical protein
MPDCQLRATLMSITAGLLALAYVVHDGFQDQWAMAPLIWVYVVPVASSVVYLVLQGGVWIFSRPALAPNRTAP